MAYYICHVIIIGHVSQYIKLTERHFSQTHTYIKKTVSAYVFDVWCFVWEMIVNVHDCICENVGCNVVTDVDKIEIVDVDWIRNLVVKNSWLGWKRSNDRIRDSFMVKLEFDRRKNRFICFGRVVKNNGWMIYGDNYLWRDFECCYKWAVWKLHNYSYHLN